MPEISIDHMISEISREKAMRHVVYPKLVARGKLEQWKCDVQMARLNAVLELLLERKAETEPKLI